MDALDPNDGVDFAAGLYNSSIFERSLMNGLTESGILVAQLGLFSVIRSIFRLNFSHVNFYIWPPQVAVRLTKIRQTRLARLPLELS